MSPPETSTRPGLLEHPDEAFGYFARTGVDRVDIEEKHMGGRAVVVLARDADAARRRFSVQNGKAGAIHIRTGRAFFGDDALEPEAGEWRWHARSGIRFAFPPLS
jgi:hypothetical protein